MLHPAEPHCTRHFFMTTLNVSDDIAENRELMNPDASAPWAALVNALRADSPIAVLEESERRLKTILADELSAPLDGARIRRLATFQQDLGFLLKYKSYAVKAAS